MLLEGIVSFKCRLMHVQIYAQLMKKQKENSHEGITWSEMGKQNVQAEKVYCIENDAKEVSGSHLVGTTLRPYCTSKY